MSKSEQNSQIAQTEAVIVETVPLEKIAKKEPARFDPNTSPSHLLHRAQQVAGDLHIDIFGPSGLTQRQLAVLAVLSAKGGVSQTDLVSKTGIDRSTLAEMVARMEAKGLMLREKSPTDSRAKSVTLTTAGKEAIDDALPKLKAIDQAVLGHLPASRRDSLLDLLTRIVLPELSKKSVKAEKETDKTPKKTKKKKERKKKKSEKS